MACRQTGHDLRHIPIFLLASTNRRSVGRLTSTDYRVEFFLLLKCCQERESIAVGRYRSRQIEECRRVLGSCTSCYLRIR